MMQTYKYLISALHKPSKLRGWTKINKHIWLSIFIYYSTFINNINIIYYPTFINKSYQHKHIYIYYIHQQPSLQSITIITIFTQIHITLHTINIYIYILYSYIYHYYHLRKLYPHQIIITNSHSISLHPLLIQTASSYSLLIILLTFSCYLKPSSIYKNLILLAHPTLDQYIYKYLGI
jgi:hypothetical protein